MHTHILSIYITLYRVFVIMISSSLTFPDSLCEARGQLCPFEESALVPTLHFGLRELAFQPLLPS